MLLQTLQYILIGCVKWKEGTSNNFELRNNYYAFAINLATIFILYKYPVVNVKMYNRVPNRKGT